MLNTVNPIMTGIRMIFITFDISIYYLLILMYELFFNIATFNIMDRELIYNLFSRIQLVVGIFMMFRLVMIIINGIVNPDTVSDSKTGGAGSMVMRVIVSLALLALIVPINIPSPRNEYERQINNNGILFGTLYSLQYRVLANNTIGKIIMGDEGSNYTSANPDNDNLSVFANRFGATMIKIFYTLNTDDNGNYVCGDGWDEEFYNQPHEDIPFQSLEIIASGVRQCNENVVTTVAKPIVTGGQYSLSMTYVISTIAGIVLVVLMFMMTFEVAKRVFQLAALQLLAPIPIISYMDPKGSKDGAFQSWLKLLGTTYADLFVRLAVIYFSFAIINSFIVRFFTNSFSLEAGAEYVGNVAQADIINTPIILSWTFIIMVIALFIFAKDAPKFLKQMLGIKGDGKFFSAFGSAMGLGVAAAGALGSFNASRQASRDSLATRLREQNGNLTEAQARAMANRGMANRARHALSGLFGAGVGLAQGSAAASESKGNALAKMMASANAMNKRNQKVRAAGVDGGSFFGAVGSLGDEIIHGENDYDRRERRLKAEEQRIKNDQAALKTRQDALKNRQDALKTDQNNSAAIKKAKDRADSKAITNSVTRAHIRNLRGVSGTVYDIQGINAEAYNSAYKSAQDQGLKEFEITDDVGTKVTIKMDDAAMVQRQVVDGNSANYYDRAVLFERVRDRQYQQYINSGVTEAEATRRARDDAIHAGGIEDTTILSARETYREANGGQNMANTYEAHNGVDGIKIQLGDINNRVDAESARIARESQTLSTESQNLSSRSQAVNDERQSLAALREKADAERLRKGGNS